MGRRAWNTIGAIGGAAALLILRQFPPDRFPFYPPCPFHLLTGLQCPGCGATRALAALLHGDVAQAWHFNALFVLLLPFVLVYVAVVLRRTPRDGNWPNPKPAVTYLLLGMALAFTVLRNW